MAWGPSSWLLLTRIFQLLGTVAGTGLNGFLTAWIYTRNLGVSKTMVVLQLLVCTILIYTTIVTVLQHTGKRTERRGWLITFIITDILFLSADLAIISLLSRSGLPDHCRDLLAFGPEKDTPFPPFTTLGFSDETEGKHGQLDKFCGYERSYFIISLGLVFSYLATVVLASLCYYQTNHTRDTKVNELLDSLQRGGSKDDVDLKLLESAPSAGLEQTRLSLAAPVSEGIITRTASLRSTTTTSTTNPRTSFSSSTRHAIPRRPIGHPTHPPLPRLPNGGGGSFVPVPLDEEDADASLVVADGMQHHRNPATPMFPIQETTEQQQQQHKRNLSSTAPATMPRLLEEDVDEDTHHPLVSDGMRPSEPMLPPYEPGPSGRGLMTGTQLGGEGSDLSAAEDAGREDGYGYGGGKGGGGRTG